MKQIFNISVLIIMAISAMGQVANVEHVPGLDGNQSVVREWGMDHTVAYTYTSSDQGVFFLEERDVSNMLSFRLPVGVHVSDFEILDDTVYLCGYYESGGFQYGFLGVFGIESVFRNGGGIMYGVFLQATHEGYSYYHQFAKPTRMDVFDYYGMKHIVVVGASELSATPGQAISSTVADIVLNGNNWMGSMLFNKRQHEHYTDIVATRNYVIATATAEGGNACYVKPYLKSANILGSPLAYGYIHQVNQGSPSGRVLVDAMERDTFAISYHYTYMGFGASTLKMFDISGGALSLLYSTNLVQSATSSASASWEMRDIRYNNTNRNLFVLQDMQYPISGTLQSAVLEYYMSNLGSLNATLSWIPQMALHSVDQYRGAGFRTIGVNPNGGLSLFDKQSGLASLCSQSQAGHYAPNTQNASITMLPIEEWNDSVALAVSVFQPAVTNIDNAIDCQQ